MDGVAQQQHQPGRTGVTGTALRLFAEHGVAGTSRQMIADAMGVAKAAVHHRCRTKDGILLGVLAPVLDALPGVLEQAGTRRGRRAERPGAGPMLPAMHRATLRELTLADGRRLLRLPQHTP